MTHYIHGTTLGFADKIRVPNGFRRKYLTFQVVQDWFMWLIKQMSVLQKGMPERANVKYSKETCRLNNME